MIYKPQTTPGMAALILAALSVLAYVVIMVSMVAFGGVQTPVVAMLMGGLYVLCGVAGGAVSAFAVFRRHERSLLVYLAFVPAALATVLLLGEVLYVIVLVLTGTAIH